MNRTIPRSTPAGRRRLQARLALVVAGGLLLPAALALGAAGQGVSGAQAASIVKTGRQIAHGGQGGVAPCASCHSTQTVAAANGQYPQLDGLSARYLAKQLHDFREGSRKNAIMSGIAKQLGKDQIKAVSAYYASLTPQPLGKPKAGAAQIERGRRLAQVGNEQRRIPACDNCHGLGGRGEYPMIPRLVDQPAGYLAGQIKAWQQGSRRNSVLMNEIANKLTAEQIQAVTAYYASLRNKGKASK